jgi:predicted CXXCH cytochrome family protein
MLKAILIFTCLAGTVPALPAADETDNASEYIGSEQCGVCHPDQYTAWNSSRHAEGQNKIEGPENASKPDQNWIENCAGCHTTGMNTAESSWMEKCIGCETCHGPGGDHILNIGDASKIVASDSADICGRCHIGNPSGESLMSDGTRYIVGYRPGMQLTDVAGLQLLPVNPAELPPPPVNNHPFIYNMWKASGHSETSGRTFTIEGKEWSGPITCVACHNPHQSENPHQLVVAPEDLCSSCHFQDAVLKGKGAEGVEQTRSLHTAISCIECHMTESNHLMRVLRPDNPDLAEDRTDTCSACHEVNSREARAHQIQDWEAWYRETLEPVQADLYIIDAALKNNPNLLDAELNKKLEVTKSNLAIVEQDGSEGVHNLDYALEIMALAKKELSKIKAAIE